MCRMASRTSANILYTGNLTNNYIFHQLRCISISNRYHVPKSNASEITSILEEKILKNTPDIDLSSTGKVLSVGDGIARIYGLRDVQAEEMVTFSSGVQVINKNY